SHCATSSHLSASRQLPRAPPTLHPFPTRRSSDLAAGSRSARWRRLPPPCLRPPRRSPPGWSGTSPPPARHRAAAARAPAARPGRSEEHTSELQSRENLVCRLLLEKKNKTRRAVWV